MAIFAPAATTFPPGPRPKLGAFANLLAFRRDPPGFLLDLTRRYGPVSSFRLAGRQIYFFSDPEAVREVLVTQSAAMNKGYLIKRVRMLMGSILGNGLLISEGRFHAQQRRLVAPAFHRERLAGYGRMATDAAREQMSGWIDGASLDLAAEISELTLVLVARALFSADLTGTARGIGDALTRTMSLIDRLRSPLSMLPWSGAIRDYHRSKAELDGMVAQIIDARRHEDEQDHGDLLSMLLLTKDEETGGPGMTDTQIRDEVMTIMLAGHETTASALAWSFHLLAAYPEAEARLHAELDAMLPDGVVPEFADLPRLPYTRQVFTEAMRLYPPAWGLLRRTTEPVEIAGWKLPADTTCILSPFATHRDPRWFPEPEKFLPERWTEEAKAARPKYAYLPFGGGPRGCAGESFAWMEGILVLATLARRWKFAPPPGSPPPEPFAAVTLRPRHGVPMQLTAR